MKRFVLLLMVVLMAVPVGMAQSSPDDKDPSHKPGIRRLHPERELAKAQKKLREQLSRRAEPKEDPWDTSDEMWGTVDLPPIAAKDSAAVEGRRLSRGQNHTSKTPSEQASLDSLLQKDYSLSEYGFRRMTWRDLPVSSTIEQLTPSFTVDDDGDCYSKYVSREKTSNEIYFVFAMPAVDSVPGPLRLCVQYCADDPLDFDQIIFTIDGYDYLFYPTSTSRDSLPEGLYCESCDEVMQAVHKDLVYALAHSNWVAVKFLSERGIHHVKMLSDGQRADFASSLDLYRLLGGGF